MKTGIMCVRQILVVMVIAIPLVFAAVFIINNTTNSMFPIFPSDLLDDSQMLKETYQAGLDHCKNTYGNAKDLTSKTAYEECIDSVERWYEENSGS